MAWLGDAFGDGLSSIKGQITKFTNDVLSEDPLAVSSFEGKIKQLEERNVALRSEIEKLHIENSHLKGGKGCELSDYQIQSICELESKIFELANEKDSLTKALDEIETEHQKELEVVIKDRDRLKNQFSSNNISNHRQDNNENTKLTEAIKSLQLQNDILFEEGKSKDDELKNCYIDNDKLLSQITTLQLQIDQFNEKSSQFNQIEYALKDKNQEIELFEDERNDMLNKISSLSDKVNILDEKCKAGHHENEEILKHIKELDLIIIEKDKQLENLDSNIKHLENENSLLIAKVKSCEDETNLNKISLRETIHDLESKNKDITIKLSDYEKNSGENNELRNKYALIETELTDLKTQLSSLKNNDQLIDLKQKLNSAEKEIKELSIKNNSLEQVINSNNDSSTETNAMMKKLNEITEVATSLKTENNDLLLKLKGTVDENATIVELLTKEKCDLQLEIKKLTSENYKTKLEDLIAKHSKKVSNLKKENSALNEKLAVTSTDLQNEITELKLSYDQRIKLLENENSGLKLEIKNLHEQSNEVENLKTEIVGLTKLNEELDNKMFNVRSAEEEIKKLKEENQALMENLQIHTEQLKSWEEANENSIETGENQLLDLKLKYESELNDLKLENNELAAKIENCQESSKENDELRSKLEKLEILVARTEERDNLVSGTLGLEIRQLKSLVGRIRKEFLRNPNEEADLCEEEASDDMMIESQTDDVKRLQQDVLQMTEVIKMIDEGLTSIYQDKTRLEKQLSIVQSLAGKTEHELSIATKAKQQLEANLQEWAAAVANRDQLIQHLTVTQSTLENNCLLLKNEKDEINAKILVLNQELDKKVLENKELNDKVNAMELISMDWNKRINELQNLYKNESERCEDLRKRKDEEIAVLNKRIHDESYGDKTIEGVTSQGELNDMQVQVARLLDENSDLKMLIQQLRENIIAMNSKLPEISGEQIQHRRSHSQADSQQNDLQTEHLRYQSLLTQHKSLIEKESSLRREIERLRAHMVEVEENYTEEAVVAKTELAELRSKLSAVEDQLHKATSVHKSANVRSTQHVEALQVQTQLIAEQRNDLQNKLSDAEDYAQKQAAALASLQLVLEQFQLDKQREMKCLQERLEYQIDLERRRGIELENEIDSLKAQQAEAQNGLKAALRLSEQLQKKSLIIADLEEELKKTKIALEVVENKLTTVNQSTSGKLDKFLVKNLVVGYLAAQGEQKNQALKILTSVLELSAEERARAGVETQSGWLSHLLHPSPNSVPSEPLSQAFVRFLESESKPQPQLRLLTETPKSSGSVKRTPLVLSDLVLPPVTPTQVSDATLNDMLKDS